jgi:hypothetical protein
VTDAETVSLASSTVLPGTDVHAPPATVTSSRSDSRVPAGSLEGSYFKVIRTGCDRLAPEADIVQVVPGTRFGSAGGAERGWTEKTVCVATVPAGTSTFALPSFVSNRPPRESMATRVRVELFDLPPHPKRHNSQTTAVAAAAWCILFICAGL